ncbi:hypothetical protein MMC13_004357 [Lambiella insularis]|nr:hypothetical protein [Lambiella insularis]
MFLAFCLFLLGSSGIAALAPPPRAQSLSTARPGRLGVAPAPIATVLPPPPNSDVVNCAPYGPAGSQGGGAPGSCQNICWYLNCFKGANRFTCDPAGASQRRKDSGCGRSPCTGAFAKKQPFQTFIANGGTGGQYLPSGKASCDEFPPAVFAQGGKNARLRCIDGSDNSRSGNVYKNSCAAHGTAPFSISSANQGALSQCKPNPDCSNSPPAQCFLKSPYSTTDYIAGKRAVDVEPEYHAMDPNLYYGAMEAPSFTRHNITRRNYLMSDGSTILLITRDADHEYEIGSRHLKEDESIITVVKKL